MHLLAFQVLARQLQDKPPLRGRDGRNTEPRLFERLEILQRLSRLTVPFQVAQRDLLLELPAKLDVHDYPFGSVPLGLGVVVWVFRVKCRF